MRTFVGAQEVSNRHDPTCFDVIYVGIPVFEKMVGCAGLDMAPIELNTHHLACLALRLPKVTHKSGHLSDALFHVEIVKPKTAHLHWP
jgi:hypothetical protein